MTRLQSELRRLYLPHVGEEARANSTAPQLIDAQGRVRAMVLELARPADWEVLGRVWRGVQQELELPAPGIAVSGAEGFQLWFSLVEAVPVRQAHAFMDGLRRRFLPEVAAKRVSLMPWVDGSAGDVARHAALVPAPQAGTENWSAFVAADLAPVFAETPWLDIEPGSDGQAELLSGLASIKPDAFKATGALLGLSAVAAEAGVAQAALFSATDELDPRRFLQRVMNDAGVPLALRIEAAKALLPHAHAHGAGSGPKG